MPLPALYSITLPSSDPVAIVFPSGEKTPRRTPLIASVCRTCRSGFICRVSSSTSPSSTGTSSPSVEMSKRSTVASSRATARREESATRPIALILETIGLPREQYAARSEQGEAPRAQRAQRAVMGKQERRER